MFVHHMPPTASKYSRPCASHSFAPCPRVITSEPDFSNGPKFAQGCRTWARSISKAEVLGRLVAAAFILNLQSI
ncbi:MAG: hypothetical protein ACD_54C01180G0005 [uncultured bacterium]|nr:MAG: hypothetical protein ACD_54C01180G0005 [uncultured bacterium]